MHLGEVFNATARINPDRLAVACGGQELTFRQLNDQGNRLANGLLAHGLTPGDRVIIFLPNDVGVAVGFIGCLKAGGLLVPVSTRLSASELAFQIGDCTPTALLYSDEDGEKVAAAVKDHPDVLLIDVSGKADAGGTTLARLLENADSRTPPPLPYDFTDAVVAYTSGTTGLPKGAILTHANSIVSQFISATQYRLSPSDIYMATSPMAHRTGFARIVTMSCLGGAMIAQPKFDPEDIARLIEKYQVTNISLVSTAAGMFVDYLEKSDHKLESLVQLVSGGEAFPLHIKERLHARLPNMGIHLFYGSTESGTISSLFPDEQIRKDGSVGQVWPGVEMRLVDENRKDVAPGEVGEVVNRTGIPGTFATFRGYFNNPEATNECFENGWFHTGDAGRLDEDGYLFLMDRVKDMILSGGLNIFSREVELAVASADGVRDVAVCAAPDAKWGEAVTAFVVREPGKNPTAEAIIDHCKEEIASYKKPSHVFFVDALPTNAVGKVLKRDLRERAKELVGPGRQGESGM